MLTTTTRSIHGRLVSITADTEVQPQTNAVFDGIASADAALLAPDASFRIGWGRAFVAARETGLQLVALDHTRRAPASPIFTDDLTVDLRVLADLETFGDTVGTRGPTPDFGDIIWIEDGIGEADDIYVERRYAPSSQHSGCFVGVCGDGPRAPIRAVRVEELLHLRPSAIQCLAMPIGAFARLHADRLTAVVTADGSDVWNGEPVSIPPAHPTLQLIDRMWAGLRGNAAAFSAVA
jgi:hypothetical protein